MGLLWVVCIVSVCVCVCVCVFFRAHLFDGRPSGRAGESRAKPILNSSGYPGITLASSSLFVLRVSRRQLGNLEHLIGTPGSRPSFFFFFSFSHLFQCIYMLVVQIYFSDLFRDPEHPSSWNIAPLHE